jgi:threonine dehydrogenase-like Zn-dependent dehydrogenase
MPRCSPLPPAACPPLSLPACPLLPASRAHCLPAPCRLPAALTACLPPAACQPRSLPAPCLQAAASSFDGIIDTVSVAHNMQPLADLLDIGGKLVLVGFPPAANISVAPMTLLLKKATIGGSLIGGLEEMQEMLDFCGEKGVASEVEVIDVAYVNEAIARLQKGDVKFRFVIDVQGSLLL